VEGEIDAMLKFLSTYGFQKPAKSHGLKRIPATGMPDCLPIGRAPSCRFGHSPVH
jgi:hypothetical protein